MILLGLDIGTTRIKALRLDTETGSRSVVARATPVSATEIGELRDADEVLSAVTDALAEAVAGVSADERRRIGGIGITSLSEEVVLLSRTGASLGAMPTWYNRTIDASAAHAAGIDPSFSWAKLRWAFDETALVGGGLAGVSRSDVAGFTTLNGYIADRLTGAGRYAVDHSHASRTGFFDVRHARWLPEVFALTGWPASALPPLVPPGASVGTLLAELAEALGVPASVPVVLAGHDHFCGAYGMGVRGDGELYVSAGTSEAHCMIVDRLPDAPLPPQIGIGRYVDGARFYLHRQLPSGHLYRHWRGILGLDALSPEAEAEALSAVPPGCRGAVLVPGLDTDARSWLLGLRGDADGATVLRAVFEGLACAALEVARGLSAASGRAITSVLAAGVPCQSPVWRAIRAQLSPAPLSISTEAEAPALGAALLAQRAVTGDTLAAPPVSTPAPDPALGSVYREQFARFERLAAAIRD